MLLVLREIFCANIFRAIFLHDSTFLRNSGGGVFEEFVGCCFWSGFGCSCWFFGSVDGTTRAFFALRVATVVNSPSESEVDSELRPSSAADDIDVASLLVEGAGVVSESLARFASVGFPEVAGFLVCGSAGVG